MAVGEWALKKKTWLTQSLHIPTDCNNGLRYRGAGWFTFYTLPLFCPFHRLRLREIRRDLHTTPFVNRHLNPTNDVYDMRGLRTSDPLCTVFLYGLSHIHHTATPFYASMRVFVHIANRGFFHRRKLFIFRVQVVPVTAKVSILYRAIKIVPIA
jgi:hypothetical protein